MENAIPERRFEWVTDEKYRAWVIAIDGNRVTRRWGKIGDHLQSTFKEYDSQEDAHKEYNRLINQKLNEGYREVKKKERPPSKTQQEFELEMAAHIPFIEAICEDRDDLTGYLVYSDWLLENGDPLGDFIRMKIELEGDNLSFSRETQLERETDELFFKHKAKWLGDLASDLLGPKKNSSMYDYGFNFKRGLLSHLRLSPITREFANKLVTSILCKTLLELNITRVSDDDSIGALDENDPIKILSEGNFPCLRKFEYGIDENGVNDLYTVPDRFAVQLLAKMPKLRSLAIKLQFTDPEKLFAIKFEHLRWLTVFNLTTAGLNNLIDSGLIKQLYELRLNTTTISEKGIQRLLDCGQFEQMSELRIIKPNHESEYFYADQLASS